LGPQRNQLGPWREEKKNSGGDDQKKTNSLVHPWIHVLTFGSRKRRSATSDNRKNETVMAVRRKKKWRGGDKETKSAWKRPGWVLNPRANKEMRGAGQSLKNGKRPRANGRT